jgi:hypothetical protein
LAKSFLRPIDDDDTITVSVDVDAPGVTTDEDSGTIKMENDDGSVTIKDLDEEEEESGSDKFEENLAKKVDPSERQRIASELLRAIETDEDSREEWLQTRSKLLDLLGFKIEDARADAGASTAPLEGMSTVRHPLLAEAVIRFQSNASGELLPTGGPVKVRDDVPPIPKGTGGIPPITGSAAAGQTPVGDRSELATALEKDFNHYLTSTDKGYRPDTDRMLFWVGFGGCSFKKVYHDPIRRMPISRMVDAADLIVSNAANDLDDCGRVTHRIIMRPSMLRRMQLAGAYIDTPLIQRQPTFEPHAVEEKEAVMVGFLATPRRPEDNPFTIYECYTEIDLKGFEHKEGGKPTGLALPYKVVIEKDSREILEIRRNWKKEDKSCLAKKVFVKYPFVPAMGFYDIGLGQIIGNASRALTGAWRLLLDAGMFNCFPGFLYAKTSGRQITNQFRIPPGGGYGIEIPAQRGIHDMIMPLPYKEPSAALLEMVKLVETTGMRLGGTAETKVAEGKQDAPVGTTLALIEQATKILAAVHIRLHAAQSEEFQMLKELFREDPEAFWRHNSRPATKWETDQFLQALNDYDMVPAADPNTPSQMHRLMKAIAIKQLQGMNMLLYDAVAVDTLVLHMIGVADPESLFAPPQGAPPPPAIPPDPNKMAEIQSKEKMHQAELQQQAQESQQEMISEAAEHKARMGEIAMQGQDRAQDRASRERVEMLKMQAQAAKDQAQMQLAAHQQQMKVHMDAQMQQQKLSHQQQMHEQQMTMTHQQHQDGMAMEQQKGQMQAHQQEQMHSQKMQQNEQQQQQANKQMASAPVGPVPRNDKEGKI